MKYLHIFLLYCALCVSVYSEDKAPVIAVDGKATVDFGTYPAKERKEAFYKITNKGKGILKIGRIRKTCGCAEAKIDKKEINPGETGTLKTVVLGDSIYGSYRKNVYVESNDPKQRFLTLTVAGKAVPIVTIKPKENIYAGFIPAEKEWKQEFHLLATESGIKLLEPILQTDTQAKAKLTKKSNKLFLLTVTITPEKGKLDFKCKVKVPVSKPKGWKAVEILIMGKIR